MIFANTTDYQGEKLHTEDLPLPIDYQVGTGNNYREVKDGDRLCLRSSLYGWNDWAS